MTLCRGQRRYRLAVVRGGCGGDQISECRPVLQATGLPDGLDPFDPAVACLGLGAALDPAGQDCVTYRSLRGVVRRIYVKVGNVTERPERFIFGQQPGSEVRCPNMAARGARLQQPPDLGAQRGQRVGQPCSVTTVSDKRTVGGEHLLAKRNEPGSALAGDAVR